VNKSEFFMVIGNPDPLAISNLTKEFGAVRALRGVTFSVAPGEIFGYLGPNGAGKTTTLRIVLGLVRPTSGSVCLFDRPPTDPVSRADIGFIPGDLRLYGDMTAQSTLDFFARFRRQPPVLRQQLLDAFALDGATLNRRVKFLSHGTRQKVGLIAAMQHDPALLLLDEPSNGLDPIVQYAFRETLRDFAARGRSVVLSSHVLSEAESVCARVAIIRQGEIVALESVEHLRANVVRKLTARFRGTVPDLSRVPGISRTEVQGDRVELWLRGDPAPILKAITAADVRDLVFPEPQLEDIFLGYYQQPDAKSPASVTHG
jgi:ABC-2 type transport system ATP-binding protein